MNRGVRSKINFNIVISHHEELLNIVVLIIFRSIVSTSSNRVMTDLCDKWLWDTITPNISKKFKVKASRFYQKRASNQTQCRRLNYLPLGLAEYYQRCAYIPRAYMDSAHICLISLAVMYCAIIMVNSGTLLYPISCFATVSLSPEWWCDRRWW